MKISKAMNYISKEQAIKALLKKHLTMNNNLFLSEKLFVAKSVINWIFDNIKSEPVKKVYFEDVEKYLKGDLELKWFNGLIIKNKSIKKEDKNENKQK